jgi:hypothetical protein
MTLGGLCTSAILSACTNEDLAAAPARGDANRGTGVGHSPVPEWREDALIVGETEAATAASAVPDRLYIEWAAQHTPVDATLRMTLRPRSPTVPRAITCDPGTAAKPARTAASVPPTFVIDGDETRCIVSPDSIAAADPLLQLP